MYKFLSRLLGRSIPALSALVLGAFVLAPVAKAADHGDGPLPSNDQAVDLGDTYAFLDPNDNTQMILGMTFRGFIVPGEAVNFGFFDNLVRYRFQLETNGTSKPDKFITVTFSKRTSTTVAQTASITLPNGRKFTAPVTLPTLGATANAQVVTTDSVSGAKFFAGQVDDPFFFDIPAFGRFVRSVTNGAADPTQFNRARDSFAGYNISAIALSVPVSLLGLKTAAGNPTGTKLGVNATAERRPVTTFSRTGVRSTGRFKVIDRSGNPGLNVLVIPFARKTEYNFATPADDENGKFADDVVAVLQALGANSDSINTLAGIYIAKGDFLRVDTAVANTGNAGGDNLAAAFPNGRRLKDDVVDTFLTVVANGTTFGDGVNASDVAPANTFPFFATPQQPFANGATDDNTRN